MNLTLIELLDVVRDAAGRDLVAVALSAYEPTASRDDPIPAIARDILLQIARD